LQFQPVDQDDSVLRRYRHRSGNGLKKTYAALVRAAFDRRYWSAPGSTRGAFGSPAAGGRPYSQIEANFAMFFGLAVQLYESTLISDQAPFDSERDAAGVPRELNEQQRRGLRAFVDLHCIACHHGPTPRVRSWSTADRRRPRSTGSRFDPRRVRPSSGSWTWAS
jgi:cytochrome c peroxidase